jgi:hypothetical protein
MFSIIKDHSKWKRSTRFEEFLHKLISQVVFNKNNSSYYYYKFLSKRIYCQRNIIKMLSSPRFREMACF